MGAPVLSITTPNASHDTVRSTMKAGIAQVNLMVAWVWILLGFLSGFGLGLNFHREDWLGGYGSYKRRLFRLGHISFFGLGVLNLMFYLTAHSWTAPSLTFQLASWGFVLGAVSMPLCCLVMAYRSTWRGLFLIPVTSLVASGLLTIWEITKL